MGASAPLRHHLPTPLPHVTQNLSKAERKLPNYQCVAFINFFCFLYQIRNFVL